MYAVVGIWSVVASYRARGERELRDYVMPMTTAQPGFVAGYWMADPETGKGHHTVVFDGEAQARQFKELLESQLRYAADQGATSDFLAVVEVVAAAQAEPAPVPSGGTS